MGLNEIIFELIEKEKRQRKEINKKIINDNVIELFEKLKSPLELEELSKTNLNCILILDEKNKELLKDIISIYQLNIEYLFIYEIYMQLFNFFFS